jgi:cytochrome P450
MCTAANEDWAAWSEDEIFGQFNFLMMAAHGSTPTALAAMIWALKAHPDWQDMLIREVAEIGPGIDWQRMPIPKPKGGLPVTLHRV